MSAGRIAHLTFEKCGSQWIKDVLSDSAVVLNGDNANFFVPEEGYSLIHFGNAPPGIVASPIYGAGFEEWRLIAHPGDRALVVLRDPRDIVVSMATSMPLSHFSTSFMRVIRPVLLSLDLRGCITLFLWFFQTYSSKFSSWIGRPSSSSEHIVSYEALLRAPETEFAAILKFFGWSTTAESIREVVERNSFQRKSGRTPGQEDRLSHQRKAVAGDWKTYFDRRMGEAFESAVPGLLTAMGLETEDCWYMSLPERIDTLTGQSGISSMQKRQASELIDHVDGRLKQIENALQLASQTKKNG